MVLFDTGSSMTYIPKERFDLFFQAIREAGKDCYVEIKLGDVYC